jgi:hypothetical protein
MTVTKEINFLYTAQDVGHEVTALKGLRVTPVGRFVLGGAVDVIEYWTGQPSLSQLPEIMKVVTVAQARCVLSPQSTQVGRLHQIACRKDLSASPLTGRRG